MTWFRFRNIPKHLAKIEKQRNSADGEYQELIKGFELIKLDANSSSEVNIACKQTNDSRLGESQI